MNFSKTLLASTVALAAMGIASAQFAGPAPLAWRWTQSTKISPSGAIVPVGTNLAVATGGRIYMIDQASGNGVWRYPAGAALESGSFNSGVMVMDNLVVAAADNKIVYAVDAETGAQKWQYISTEKIVGAPAAVGKFVALQLGDGSLMVIRSEDGTPVWENSLRFFGGLVGQIGGFGNTILAAGGDRKIYAVDVASKKVRWQTALGNLRADFRPVVNGDYLYVSTGDSISILSASSGTRRKEIMLREPLGTNPAYGEGKIAVVARSGKLFVVDDLGRPMMKKPMDIGSMPIVDPVVTKSGVSVMTANGSVNFVDFGIEAITWNYIVRPLVAPADANTPNYVTVSGVPAAIGNSLFAMGRDGSLLCFDRKNGVDVTGPSTKMLFPNSGDQVSGQPPLQLYFRLSDESTGIDEKSIKVMIDGVKYNHEYTRDGWVIVKFGPSVKNPYLQDGRKNITVESADWLGNRTVETFALTIDNGLRPIKLPGAPASGTDGAGGLPGGPGGVGGRTGGN